MSVKAIGPYDFPMKDVRENFPAPLLYIGWEDHLMFTSPICLPLPPDTREVQWSLRLGHSLVIAPLGIGHSARLG